jgi:hypothetical protein
VILITAVVKLPRTLFMQGTCYRRHLLIQRLSSLVSFAGPLPELLGDTSRYGTVPMLSAQCCTVPTIRHGRASVPNRIPYRWTDLELRRHLTVECTLFRYCTVHCIPWYSYIKNKLGVLSRCTTATPPDRCQPETDRRLERKLYLAAVWPLPV